MNDDSKKTRGGRLRLPEPLANDLVDFQSANYEAKAESIVQEALREHIDRRLQEPEMRKRFDQARARRTRSSDPIKLVRIKR